jgi:hypothetical protein
MMRLAAPMAHILVIDVSARCERCGSRCEILDVDLPAKPGETYVEALADYLARLTRFVGHHENCPPRCS